MSGSNRELRILEAILKTNLPQMGWPESGWLFSQIIVDNNGDSTLYVNATHGTGAAASDDVAVFIRLKDVGDIMLSDSMRTQDHGSGLFVHSSCVAEVLAESPAVWTSAHAKLVFDAMHIVRGVYGAPVNMFLAPNTDVIAIDGVDGAGADANIPASPVALSVTGRSFAGGI
jgi:hypothetical protein